MSGDIPKDEFDLAFPLALPILAKGADGCPQGLTKRELLAAMALQGMLASDSWYNTSVELTTAQAVQYANALLTELAK